MLSRIVLLFALIGLSVPAMASTAWINDSLYVPVRATASPSGRIVHRGLRTGTRIQFLGNEGDWAKIRFNSTEGYIEQQYLSRTPIAALQLDSARQETAKLKSENTELREQLAELRQQRDGLANRSKELESSLSSRNSELEQLQTVAADPIRLDQANRRLNEELSLLRSELDQVKAENIMLRSDNTARQWLTGVGILFLGGIIGMILRSRNKRQRNSGWAN